ncbi:MAG: PqiC family protein [Gammaproteobacteria bacterium]|nr:PqiC family protein [Gammaproteobacteria bacterium]MCI0590858.1 PqiC family protein [Gammaproteobacteria bacterium]
MSTPLAEEMVLVKQFNANGVYIERAMLFTNDAQSVELQQYRYHFWQDSPGRLVRDHLVSYLRDANAAAVVATENNAAAELVISGKITQFEQRKRPDSIQVAVALELRVDRPGGDRPILLNRYSTQVAVDGDSFEATVRAFNKALLQLFDEFLTVAQRAVSPSQ